MGAKGTKLTPEEIKELQKATYCNFFYFLTNL